MRHRDRLALIWGACAIATGSVLLRIGPWAVGSILEARQQLATRSATLAEARWLVEAAPALRDSLATALRGFVGLAPKLVAGRTQAEASAEMASDVRTLANRTALKLVQLTPKADATRGILRRVTLHGEFQGDVAGMSAFIRGVETGDRLLTLESLSVVAPDPVPRPGAAEVLHVELDITGWYLPGAEQ